MPTPPCRVPAAQGKTKLARIKYQKAIKLVDRAFELEGEEQVAAASQLKASCLLNLARCAEREQEWGEALGWCNKAIRWGATRRSWGRGRWQGRLNAGCRRLPTRRQLCAPAVPVALCAQAPCTWHPPGACTRRFSRSC